MRREKTIKRKKRENTHTPKKHKKTAIDMNENVDQPYITTKLSETVICEGYFYRKKGPSFIYIDELK